MSDRASEVYNFIGDYAVRDIGSAIVRIGELIEIDDMKPVMLEHYVELNMCAKHLFRIMQELQEWNNRG